MCEEGFAYEGMSALEVVEARGLDIVIHGIDRGHLSIADDDICSGCADLLYAPGETSLCNSPQGMRSDWPCRFDDDGEAVECDCLNPLGDGQTNIVDDI